MNHGIHQASHKQSLSAGTIGKIRESIQSLQNHLGTGDSADAVYSVGYRKRQDRLALEWANNNNIPIISEKQFLDRWNISGKIRGGENRVYFEQYDDGSTWVIHYIKPLPIKDRISMIYLIC